MTHTLIIGASGKLGRELTRQLEPTWGDRLAVVGRERCNLRSMEAIRRLLDEVRPTRVFNAAAYNDVDGAESCENLALDVNAMGPARLASACREIDARLVHFSTDYVFGEGFDEPIDESHQPDPLSVYGRSKLLGERLALQNNPQTFVLRVTGLYSHRRDNFVKSMIRHALAGTSLTVVDDQRLSPTWVRPLADRAIELSRREVFGTYHAVCRGGCSWYEFASAIFETLEIEADLSPTSAAEWGAEAPRPAYSVLENRLLELSPVEQMPAWRESLEAFLGEYGRQLIDQLGGD